MCFGAAIPVACGSIYKSFAQCLLALGDSLVETQKDQDTQDIDSICRCVFAVSQYELFDRTFSSLTYFMLEAAQLV